jgi:hypothetical protein
MSLHVTCALCEQELIEPGGLLICPPTEASSTDTFVVDKVHVCRPCWEPMMDALLELHIERRQEAQR